MSVNLHMYEPLGGDGSAPFSAVSSEVLRARQVIRSTLFIRPGEWPMTMNGTPLEEAIDEPADKITEATLRAIVRARLKSAVKFVDFTRIDAQLSPEDNGMTILILIDGIINTTGEPFNIRELARFSNAT